MATLERPVHTALAHSPPPAPFHLDARPTPFFVPSRSVNQDQDQDDDQDQHSVDLIALGEEPLFSGERRRNGDVMDPTTSTDAAPATSTVTQTDPFLAPGLVRSLSAAKSAFLLTLQRLLEPPLFQDVVPSPSSLEAPLHRIPHSAPSVPTSFQSPGSAQERALMSLLDSLRLKSAHRPASPLPTGGNYIRSRRGSVIPALGSVSSQEVLMDELEARVDLAASELSPLDAELARSLGALLACMERLITISNVQQLIDDDDDDGTPEVPSQVASRTATATNVYAQLEKEARALGSNKDQWTQDSVGLGSVVGAAREVERAEREVLWGTVDELLERVGGLCRQRGVATEREERIRTLGRPPSIGSLASAELPSYSSDHPRLPPAYVTGDSTNESPEYPDEKSHHHSSHPSENLASTSNGTSHLHHPEHDEKMRIELDIVSTAIERLYLVSPQLANQRVDVDRTLSRQRQLTNLGNAIERLSKGRLDNQRAAVVLSNPEERAARTQKDHDAALDDLMEKINRAASRTLVSQRVDLSAKRHLALKTRSTEFNAALDDYDDREEILRHNGKGRLVSQDAVLKDYESPITLGQFFGDSSSTILSPSPGLRKAQSFTFNEERVPTSRKGSPLRLNVFKIGSASMPMARRSSSGSKSDLGIPASTVEFVVEESRNIGTVVVTFWTVPAGPSSSSWEIISILANSIIVARKPTGVPIRIPLPCQVLPQPATVTPNDTFFEVKLSTADSSITRPRPDLEVHAPLSTAQLRESLPVSFVCANCRTEIVESSSVAQYNALPSEHWAELLDAWMCHQDQALSDDLVAKGKGIKPRENEALVGSTYIVFRRDITGNWFCPGRLEPTRSEADDLLHPAHCTSCDTLVGQHVVSLAGDGSPTYLRLLKYATEPTTPSLSPHAEGRPRALLPRYSLASHLTAEMLEIGQAHACHRFVIEDVAQAKARLLLWLFNPAVRICFSTSSRAGRFLDQQLPRAEAAPTSESSTVSSHRTINAVKVFYSAVSDESSTECQEFINSEHLTTERLSYPLDVIERLTELLQASSSVFPASKRSWGSFRAGFLERI